MKKLANEYYFSKDPQESGLLKSVRNGRTYNTKMKPEDLPVHYCDVYRHWYTHNMINCKGVVDIKYKWVEENHFMKDSVLRISYTGKIEEFHPTYTINGEVRESFFSEYKNCDVTVFGNDILKCLAYIQKYSDYDISEVRSEFIKQCEWLKENEPAFAPKADDFGKWFDDEINSY